MPDALCWLSVAHGRHSVDLALPSDTPVGVLLPSIVGLVHDGAVAVEQARQWHLSRVGGEPLEAAASLRDNAIRDGDLLLLTTTPVPAPVCSQDDPWHAAIATIDSGRVPTPVTATVGCLCAAVLGATALVWSGAVTHATGHTATAGVIAAVAAFGAVALRRVLVCCCALSAITVLFAAAAGFLAVPDGPSTASSLLAASVGCSMSILLRRVTRCGAICLTSSATFAALATAASACGVAWSLPVSTTGAALSVLSLGTLGAAARLSITLAGLAPAMSAPDDDPASEKARTTHAHRTLTGLVIGSAGAAALGGALVASSRIDDGSSWPQATAFAAVVGLVMVLRARTHIDMRRRVALVVCGLTAMAAGAALTVVSAPGQANWISVLATAIGVSMPAGAFGATVSPLARRAVEALEYVALATVVPLACWVGGLYGLVRGLSLP